jgi:UTP--glucose-1-phosphate uridylyltransferase
VAGWFAESASPFAIEAVRRTPSHRKGGHFAIRRSDGRIVLRETAQTLESDMAALGDLSRHKFMSTNNIWINLEALRNELASRDGILGLPLIRNVKNVDPTDATSPKVVQIESAMGAAIEIFAGARTIEVGTDRYIPVKSTNDLLVLRSDVYEIGTDFVLDQAAAVVPFVDLDGTYKLVAEFDKRFKSGAPSLRDAESLIVDGDWDFGQDVKVVGAVKLSGERGRVDTGTVLRD